jgi:hypothetical protein
MAVRPIFSVVLMTSTYILFVLRPVKCLGHFIFAGGVVRLNTVVFQPLGGTLVKPMGNTEI